MKLRLELIDDHDGSVSYRMVDITDMAGGLHIPSELYEITEDMLDSYQKSKQKI